ncbi:MAG TPA: hypothetical protein VLZ84_12290 [Asticcacaulis sp.]|nr:hypothetical protein [Asticcacaulis sp.]
MVDALTGVTIIALMIAVCLATVKIARHFSQTATDMSDATVLLSTLMETTPRMAGVHDGKSGGMAYHVEVDDEANDGSHLCLIKASVRPRPESRVYRLNGARWCDRVAT